MALVGAAGIAAAAPPTRAQDDAASEPRRTEWSLQLEGGSEYDSNVHRADRSETDPGAVVGSPLGRLGARHHVSWRRTPRELFTLSSYGGLKLFTSEDGQVENVAVLSADGGYDWHLSGRGAILGLTGSYYDAIPYHVAEPVDDDRFKGRHFRVGNGEASLALLGQGVHRVSAVAGYRVFHYKPDPDVDWRGEHIGLLYEATFWRGDPDRDDDAAQVDLVAGYRVERRGYAGSALTSACADRHDPDPMCTSPTALPRADLNHSLVAEGIYTGERVYSARYELQVNDSNSFGQSLLRQKLRLGLTTELFRDLVLTAEATILVDIYSDPLLVPGDQQALTFVSIDEENRNSLAMHLSRPLTRNWAIEGRYAIYSNEFTNHELTFRRQTVYLGAVYRYGR